MTNTIQLLEKQFALLREPWAAESNTALEILTLESRVGYFLHLFETVNRLDEQYRLHMFRGTVPHLPQWEHTLEQLIRLWGEAVRTSLAPQIEKIESQGYKVCGVKELRENMAEAKGICTPDDQFFTDDKFVELQDRALDAHRRGETEPFPEAS